jgi:type I restriction enzyme, S subunit
MSETKVPKGYKRIEVGVIPEDWEVKPLSAIAEKIMVGIASAATHAYRESGIVLFRNQNIKPNYLDDRDVLYITSKYENAFKNKRLQAGDLLTARTGYPGTTCLVPAAYASAQSFTTLITRPSASVISGAFLSFYINSEIGQRFFEQNQIGGGQKNVNAGSLKMLPVLVPPLPEQRAIATALSDVDALIAGLDQLITKKRNLKQAAMQQLLTGQKRLPGFQNKIGFQHSEIGMIPEDWTFDKLGSIAQLERGKFSARPRNDPKYFGGTFPFIQTGDVSNSNGWITEFSQTLNSEGLKISKIFLHGTLFFTIAANIGDVAFASFDAACPDSLVGISALKKTDIRWLFHILKSKKRVFEGLATQNAQLNINLEKLRPFSVAVPPLSEQTAIATILSDMDSELTALEQRRDKTRALKLGMMQELLTGKTRLI